MITMEMFGKVRRMFFRDGISRSEIARRTGLSRTTIKKWVKVPLGTEPKYQRVSKPGKLGEFKEELVRALKADAHRPRRNRRTALALFDTIKTNGYAGGYTAVTDFIRGWHERSGHAVTRAFVPLRFELGEAHPVRLERRASGDRRRLAQDPGRAPEAVRQPCLCRAGVPDAEPRDAVRCPHAVLHRVGRHCRAAASTTT